LKYDVRLTDKAEADIDAALGWLHEQGATVTTERWFARLMTMIGRLETRPERCAIAFESEDLGEVRELLFGKRAGVYRILFRIEGRNVHILRIWHGARNRLSPRDL